MPICKYCGEPIYQTRGGSWVHPDGRGICSWAESSERQMRCPGCDCEPVGYTPHNGKGDCPAARSSRSSPADQTNAPYR